MPIDDNDSGVSSGIGYQRVKSFVPTHSARVRRNRRA